MFLAYLPGMADSTTTISPESPFWGKLTIPESGTAVTTSLDIEAGSYSTTVSYSGGTGITYKGTPATIDSSTAPGWIYYTPVPVSTSELWMSFPPSPPPVELSPFCQLLEEGMESLVPRKPVPPAPTFNTLYPVKKVFARISFSKEEMEKAVESKFVTFGEISGL
jgi:hypothetical protein